MNNVCFYTVYIIRHKNIYRLDILFQVLLSDFAPVQASAATGSR